MTAGREFSAAATLATAQYIRERLHPVARDPLYLHLSDLKLALERVLPPSGENILDYGCGGSPYRPLFQTEHYHRADLRGTAGIDYVFEEDSRLSAPDASYDCVLSSQVLEHVRNVSIYLEECRRLLRPKGRLILSTHGTFGDHGCPHDFRRWTADGLRMEIENMGFRVAELFKLTTGPRGLLFLNQQFHDRLLISRRSAAGLMLRLSRLVYTRLRRGRLNELADREFAAHRIANAAAPGHELYIALMAVAHPVE